VRLLFFFWAGLWSFSETLAAGKNMLHAQSQETAKDPSAADIGMGRNVRYLVVRMDGPGPQ
jgi:hypothetical protein